MTEQKKEHGDFHLAAALAPKEFPDEAARIEDHAGTCESCRKELHALKALDSFLRQHKDQLADALSDCPSPGELVEFASGEGDRASISRHLLFCSECRNQVDLAKDILGKCPAIEDGPITATEKAAVRKTVSRLCGVPETANAVPLKDILDRIRTFFHVPSLAMGAVAAAAVIVLLLPGHPKEQHVVPVFSDVNWKVEASRFAGKSLFAPDETAVAKKNVGLVLLVPESSGLTASEIDDIYRKVAVAGKLSASFDFMTPEQIKGAAAGRVGPDSLGALTALLKEAVSVDHLLLFQITESERGYTLVGRLITRDARSPRCEVSRTGVGKDSLGPRIGAMSSDLLTEVVQP